MKKEPVDLEKLCFFKYLLLEHSKHKKGTIVKVPVHMCGDCKGYDFKCKAYQDLKGRPYSEIDGQTKIRSAQYREKIRE